MIRKFIALSAFAIIGALLIANPAQAAYSFTQTGTNVTSSMFTASFHFQGSFASAQKVFAWIGNADTNSWVDRTLMLTNISPSMTTADFDASFNFTNLGLTAGTTYRYYLANGTSDAAVGFAGPYCFKTTGVVTCPSGAGGSTGGAGSGGAGGATTAPATFNYIGTPSVVCDTNLALCYFKMVIQTTSAGTLSFKLHGFPKTTYDAGNHQYAPLVNQTESPTVASGQQYQIAFSGSFAQIQAFTTAANDSKFYFTFYEEKNQKTSALSNVFDMAAYGITYIPNSNYGVSPSTGTGGSGAGSGSSGQSMTLPGSPSVGLPSITIMPLAFSDTGTLTITGSIQAPGTPVNVDIALFMGTDPNDLDSVGSLFSGTLNTAKSFSKSFVEQAAGTYYFEIRDLMSGYSYGPQSFTITDGQGNANGSASFDYGNGGAPAGTAVNGACGSAAGTTAPTISSLAGDRCMAGSPSTVIDSGANWSWTCGGLNGGDPADCTANKGTDATGPTSWLKNPLAAGLDTFPKIFKAVYNGIILPAAIPFLAIMIMYSGFLFVIGRKKGSTDGIENAKRVFKYTMIGAVLILGGMVIANALQGTLCEIINNCPAVPSV